MLGEKFGRYLSCRFMQFVTSKHLYKTFRVTAMICLKNSLLYLIKAVTLFVTSINSSLCLFEEFLPLNCCLKNKWIITKLLVGRWKVVPTQLNFYIECERVLQNLKARRIYFYYYIRNATGHFLKHRKSYVVVIHKTCNRIIKLYND